MNAVRPVIASNGVPYLQMRSVVSYSTSGREKEGNKERSVYILRFMEPWAVAKKASVAVPPAPVRVPSQGPLAPSVASVTSVANDKGDNEMILGAVHRSPSIYLTAE